MHSIILYNEENNFMSFKIDLLMFTNYTPDIT